MKKRSNWFGIFAGVLLIGIAILAVTYFFSQALNPAGAVDEQLREENERLKQEAAQSRAEEFYSTVRVLGVSAFLAGIVALFLFFYFKARPTGSRALTIDEVERRCCELAKKKLVGRDPLWVETSSWELKAGRKFLLVTMGFAQKQMGGEQYWRHTKIVGVDPLDFDRARVEDIPMGLSVKDAIKHVMSELSRHGYLVHRELDDDAKEVFEGLAAKRKRETEVLEGFGIGGDNV